MHQKVHSVPEQEGQVMIGYLYNFFSNKKNINLAFLLRPGVKLDDLSIQVASTLSQEEVLSRS